jgi:predicted ATP-dependent protease
MNAIGTVFRLVGQLIRHPATQRVINHAIREATAELVRHIQRRTRGRTTKIHYS